MIDTDDPDIPAFTTARLVRAWEAAHPRLVALTATVAPHARSRPDAPVAGDLLVLARQALRAIAPVVLSLGAPQPVPLHAPMSYAGLAARLALATQQAETFRRRYRSHNARLGRVAWHVLAWLEAEERRRAVMDDLRKAGLLELDDERWEAILAAIESKAVPGPEIVPATP